MRSVRATDVAPTRTRLIVGEFQAARLVTKRGAPVAPSRGDELALDERIFMNRSLSSDELDAVSGCGYVETDVPYRPTFFNRAQRMFDDASSTVLRNWDDGWRILGYDMPSRLPSNVESPYNGPSFVQQVYGAGLNVVHSAQRNADDFQRILGYEVDRPNPTNSSDTRFEYDGPSMVQRAYGAGRDVYDAVSSNAAAIYDALPSVSSGATFPPLQDAEPLPPAGVPDDPNQYVGALDTPTSEFGADPTETA